MKEKEIENADLLNKRFGPYATMIPAFYREVSTLVPEMRYEIVARILNTKLHFGETDVRIFGMTESTVYKGKRYNSIKITNQDENTVRTGEKTTPDFAPFFKDNISEKIELNENIHSPDFDDNLAFSKNTAGAFVHELLHAMSGAHTEPFNKANYIYSYSGPRFVRDTEILRLGNVSYHFYSFCVDSQNKYATDPYALFMEEGIVSNWENDILEKIVPESYGNAPFETFADVVSTFCGMWNVLNNNILRREFVMGESASVFNENERETSAQTAEFKKLLYLYISHIKPDCADDRRKRLNSWWHSLKGNGEIARDDDEYASRHNFRLRAIARYNKELVDFCDSVFANKLDSLSQEQIEKYRAYREQVVSGKLVKEHIFDMLDSDSLSAQKFALKAEKKCAEYFAKN